MVEKLQIQLELDTSPLDSGLNKVKNTISNTNKQINSALQGSSATEKSTKNTSMAMDKVSNSLKKVSESISKVKGMSLFDVAGTMVGLKAVQATLQKINDVKLEKFGFTLSGAIEEVKDKLEGSMNMGAGGGFVFGDADTMKNYSETMKKYRNLQDKLGEAVDAGDWKALKALKTEMKGLGINTGGTLTTVKSLAKVLGTLKLTALAVAGAIATLVAIFAAIAAIGTAAALKVSKLGNEIYHTANQFGFSTKAFQEWSYVMERSGSSIEDLKGFLETLGSEQAAVITGSEEAAQKFKNLGISAEEAAGMDSQALFEKTIEKLQGIEDATKRSAYAYEMFGDEASRLMNVINMNNAEMQEMINNYNLLGGSMSDKLIAQSNSLQGSISNMKQAWKGISNTLAEAFIPVVQKVVNWLTKAFVWVNLFLRTIFGLDLTPAAKSTDKAVASTNKYTGGIKAAKKAAEELKRTTMGFDELNIVADPNKSSGSDSSSSSSGGGFGGNIPSLDDSLLSAADLNLGGMYAWFEEYKGLIAQITTWSLILIGVILAVIGVCTVNIPMALLGIGMAGLGIAIGFSSGAFAEAWEGFKNVVKSICEAIGIDVEVVSAAISKFFEVAWIVIKGVWDLVGPYFEIVWAKISGVFSVVVTYLGGMFTTAWTVIKSVWNTVKAYFELVWAGIKAVFAVVKAVLSGDFSGAWDAIKNVWNKAKAFFASIWDGIKNVFASVVNWFGNTFSAAWNAITKVFSKVGNFFKGVWNTIKDIFKSIGGSIGEAVSNAFSSAINWVLDKAIGIINGFISAINTAIGVINKIPGVEIKKLSKLQVPKLAEGGIATRSVLANIGEAGKEAVLPLENNTGWMDTLADKIAERNGSPSKIVLKIGEKEFAWAAINGINSITKQTGEIQLTI